MTRDPRAGTGDGTPAGSGLVPKTIWFLWFQGLAGAPYVVRKCHESWVAQNPGWRIAVLDQATLPEFAALNCQSGALSRLSRQHQADLARLDLLTRHGGVWADATTFCMRPLDEWLPASTQSGFFAFHRPDRGFSSWFLAAAPGNELVSRLLRELLAYWGRHHFRNEELRLLRAALQRILARSARTRGWWFSPPLRDWLAIYPYFALNYLFEKLVSEDSECARIWLATPRVSADGPHRLYRAGLLSPLPPAVRAEIDSRAVPVYKTTWKLGGGEIPAGSTLSYLLRTQHGPGSAVH